MGYIISTVLVLFGAALSSFYLGPYCAIVAREMVTQYYGKPDTFHGWWNEYTQVTPIREHVGAMAYRYGPPPVGAAISGLLVLLYNSWCTRKPHEVSPETGTAPQIGASKDGGAYGCRV